LSKAEIAIGMDLQNRMLFEKFILADGIKDIICYLRPDGGEREQPTKSRRYGGAMSKIPQVITCRIKSRLLLAFERWCKF